MTKSKIIKRVAAVAATLVATLGIGFGLRGGNVSDDINKNNSTFYLILFRVVKSFERIGDISIEITEATTQFYIENQSNLNSNHFQYLNKK